MPAPSPDLFKRAAALPFGHQPKPPVVKTAGERSRFVAHYLRKGLEKQQKTADLGNVLMWGLGGAALGGLGGAGYGAYKGYRSGSSTHDQRQKLLKDYQSNISSLLPADEVKAQMEQMNARYGKGPWSYAGRDAWAPGLKGALWGGVAGLGAGILKNLLKKRDRRETVSELAEEYYE